MECSRLVLIVVVLDLAGIFMDSPGAAYTRFGFNLFQKLNKVHDGNIFFSPVGIAAAIGMLVLEAQGAAAVQLQKVRRLPCCLARARLWEQPSSMTLKWGLETENEYEDTEQFQIYQGSPPPPNIAMPSALWCLKFL